MTQIILTIIFIIASVFLYNIPIVGALVCLLALTFSVKLIRESNYIFGLIGLIICSVTTLLSVLVILITFNVIKPLGFDIGYNDFYTKKINSMLFLGNLDERQQKIENDIQSYITKRTVYGVGSVNQSEAIKELLLDSSNVKIYYSSKTMEALKGSIDDELYEKIKSFVATKDSKTNYYLLNFSKLYEVVKPMDQLEESKRGYWLIDLEGNVYLNIKDLHEYIYNKQ